MTEKGGRARVLLLVAPALLLFFRNRLISGAAVFRHPEYGRFRASSLPGLAGGVGGSGR